MAKKFITRFNLGTGENYMKWKVTSPTGNIVYYEPNDVTLFIEGCKLVNRKGAAKKIFDGANKEVCAWVESKAVTVYHKMPVDFTEGGMKVSYNPRVTPNWVMDGKDVDKLMIGDLISTGRDLNTTK